MELRVRYMRGLFGAARKAGLTKENLEDMAAAGGLSPRLSELTSDQLAQLTAKIGKQPPSGMFIAGDGGDMPLPSPAFLFFRRPPEAAKKAMLGKISKILYGMGADWNYADGIARRMFGAAMVDDCTPMQLHGVVSALEKKRRAAK